MRTRELLHLENTGHQGINALFSKAHSADWDIDRDVDWSAAIAPGETLVDHDWNPFGRTATFRALPVEMRDYVTRRGVGRVLNILQVGESVAQDVCAKLALLLRHEDHRNAAVAQAMDEARHHLAYRRIIEKMGEELEDIDLGTEMVFDELLASDDPLVLISTEQLFLESMAMSLFDGLYRHATSPLLRDVLALITRDESRHMGFGVLYVAEWMKAATLDERVAFAQRWLGQTLFSATDRPGPLMLRRLLHRLAEAGHPDPTSLGPELLREQAALNEAEDAALLRGQRIPQLLKSARHAGLLAPEILDALDLRDHPVIRAVMRSEPTPDDERPPRPE